MQHNSWIIIYTDGSCLGNPGPGGWAAILQLHERNNATNTTTVTERMRCGRSRRTTNNRMELRAAIEALNAITRPGEYPIEIRSDSQYVVNGATAWMPNWKRNGWRTSQRKPVENRDLWQQLDAAIQRHGSVTFTWVQGHAQDSINVETDQIARHQASNVTDEDKEDMEA